jgi:hypothetical protein
MVFVFVNKSHEVVKMAFVCVYLAVNTASKRCFIIIHLRSQSKTKETKRAKMIIINVNDNSWLNYYIKKETRVIYQYLEVISLP